MQVALTGATGFVGRYIARQMVADGHACRCWFRPSSDRTGLEELANNVAWVSGSLGEVQSARDLVEGCDVLVHAALNRAGDQFRGGEGELLEFVQTNLMGTLQLIETARSAGVKRIVLLSTCAVHEKILDDRPLDETHPLWPASHYGAHKAALEKFVHSYGFGMGYPICALRPTGVYGLAHPASDSKWFDLVRTVVEGGTVSCNKGGKEVHAQDVARAVGVLLSADDISGQAYSCYDRYVSQHEVATIARRLSNSSCRIEGHVTTPKHQIENTKLQAIGARFGGTELLERTIGQLVDAAR